MKTLAGRAGLIKPLDEMYLHLSLGFQAFIIVLRDYSIVGRNQSRRVVSHSAMLSQGAFWGALRSLPALPPRYWPRSADNPDFQ